MRSTEYTQCTTLQYNTGEVHWAEETSEFWWGFRNVSHLLTVCGASRKYLPQQSGCFCPPRRERTPRLLLLKHAHKSISSKTFSKTENGCGSLEEKKKTTLLLTCYNLFFFFSLSGTKSDEFSTAKLLFTAWNMMQLNLNQHSPQFASQVNNCAAWETV